MQYKYTCWEIFSKEKIEKLSMQANKISVSQPISRLVFDQTGQVIEDVAQSLQLHTRLNEDYYTNELSGFMGPSELVAWFEVFTASVLAWLIKSPATFTNAATSLGELLQVKVANTKLFGDPKSEDNGKRKEAEIRREGIMAWLQVLAGTGGLLHLGLEVVKNKEHELQELPFVQKIILSTTSLFSTVFMFFGGAEKNLIATLAKNDSTEDDCMRMNAHSDFRCFAEWGTMTIFPWISEVKPVRALVDILIPFFALREGIGHFIREGINFVFNNKVVPIKEGTKRTLKTVFFTNGDKHDHKESNSIPWPFNTQWFLGNSKEDGVRDKYLIPLLKLFRCNPPVCFINDDQKIVSEFYENGQTRLKTTMENKIHPDKSIHRFHPQEKIPASVLVN